MNEPWKPTTLGAVTSIASGEAPVHSASRGDYVVMGANGPIGVAIAANFADGFLIGRVGAVGSVHRVRGSCWASDNTLTIRGVPDAVDNDFLNHLLKAIDLSKLSTQTAQPLITQTQLKRIPVLLPTLNEQYLIAEILDALDKQISSIESVIAKSLRYRLGLVSDLLDRCPRDSTLRDALAEPPGNGIYKPAGLIGRGSLLVGQTAFTSDRVVDNDLGRRAVVSPSELERFGLREGDILVSRVFATLDGVGQPALVRSLPEPAVYESNMMRLRPDPLRADSYFVFLTLQTRSAREWVVQRANLSNQASIAQSVMTFMPIWLPELDEQHRIGSVVSAEEEKRQADEGELRKLILLRDGLSSDLLTGRVRVPAEAR